MTWWIVCVCAEEEEENGDDMRYWIMDKLQFVILITVSEWGKQRRRRSGKWISSLFVVGWLEQDGTPFVQWVIQKYKRVFVEHAIIPESLFIHHWYTYIDGKILMIK